MKNHTLAFFAGIGLGFAYLTKEPGMIVGLAFVLFLVSLKRFSLGIAMSAGLASVVGLEFLWYFAQSGDLLFRVHALAAHNRSPEVIADNADLKYRLVSGYPRMMLIPNLDFGVHSVLALVCTTLAFTISQIRKHSGSMLLLLWALLPFLYLDFGSSSLTSYIALPMAARYIGIIYAPLFCLAAVIISLAMLNEKIPILRVATLTAVAGIAALGAVCGLQTAQTGYRTAEVGEMKRLLMADRDARLPECASSAEEKTRCTEIVSILGQSSAADGQLRIEAAVLWAQQALKAEISKVSLGASAGIYSIKAGGGGGRAF